MGMPRSISPAAMSSYQCQGLERLVGLILSLSDTSFVTQHFKPLLTMCSRSCRRHRQPCMDIPLLVYGPITEKWYGSLTQMILAF